MTNVTEKPELDLRFSHAEWTFGDIRMFLTWTLSDRRPAMVLLPARMTPGTAPCVIKLDGAYLWTDTVVGDRFHQERAAGEFAAHLGFNPFDHGVRNRIITIIQNRLQDLLTMPPLIDTGEVATRADITLTNLSTGKVAEIEAKTDV